MNDIVSPEGPGGVRLPDGWEKGKGQARTLSKRFDFTSYAVTRRFLDALAELAERRGRHPNISFGTTYVNVTLERLDDAAASTEASDVVAADDVTYLDGIEAAAADAKAAERGGRT